MDHSQVIRNGFGLENNVDPPAILSNAQNSTESELATEVVYKVLDHLTGSTTPPVPLNVQTKPNMFDLVCRGAMPTESLQESISDAENLPSQPQPQWWNARPYATECAVPNNLLNVQEELAVDSGSDSISSAYSQGWASAFLSPTFNIYIYIMTLLHWLPNIAVFRIHWLGIDLHMSASFTYACVLGCNLQYMCCVKVCPYSILVHLSPTCLVSLLAYMWQVCVKGSKPI